MKSQPNKTVLPVMAGLVFLALAVSGSFTTVSAQLKVTGCLKNGKLKNVELGENPRKACKSNQTPIMLPITAKTDELMAQDDQLMNDVTSVQADVAGLSANVEGLQTQVDAIVTSSLIGGATNPFPVDAEAFEDSLRYMGMFVQDAAFEERDVQQKISANGTVTKMSVVANAGPGANGEAENIARYALRIKRPGEDPESTALSCDIVGTPEDPMCVVEGCVEYQMGDLISVEISLTPVEGVESAILQRARWNARFVENGECPEVVEG